MAVFLTNSAASAMAFCESGASLELAFCRTLASRLGTPSHPHETSQTPDRQAKMILTQCAACAAPLGLASGKKCGRCSTRYCGPACQKQHWDGGHKDVFQHAHPSAQNTTPW